MKDSFGNDQDRSGACDLASCAAGLGAVMGEKCSFHGFPVLTAGLCDQLIGMGSFVPNLESD